MIIRSLTPDRAHAVSISHPDTRSRKLVYDAVMARRISRPRCLEFSRRSPESAFLTASLASVRINSMWHGLDMYGLI
jgi:hypothetical protein